MSITLEVQASQRCSGGPGLPEEQSKTESLGYKTRARPMAKKRKTVVKKIPALRQNVSSNALKTKTKIASMQEKIQVLNKDINATEDEKINEMIKVSEEIAEYHH